MPGRLDIAVERSGGIRDDASPASALATGCARVNLGTAALESPKLEVDDNFKAFLDIFQNPESDTSPSTANGAVYQTQFDSFVEQWQRGQVSDLDAVLKQVDEVIDNALALGQAPYEPR